ncbi:MAG: tRNA (adenosine(37)-N6)-dimethylallyltransferase MiaA [Desulfobacterota bacterium]|nr:tRNA (adenosine(37)-N6)-dimethylallyltransferase MiaA [Thermodesulfobacteriota bacterium]
MADDQVETRPRVVILAGPTGVGKSKLAIELAETFGGEILNADSMQVYRYMDIGTAKPTLEERRGIPHHLLDLVTPDQPFHAELYRRLGRKVIDDLHRKGTPIFVVGGTGLYLRALTQGLFASPKTDPLLRERLRQEAMEKGRATLYQRLQVVDPEAASQIHPNDLIRTVRALEVYETTGIPISWYWKQHRFGDRPYKTLKIGLWMERKELYRRIEQRVDRMIALGLLEEVEGLLKRGYGPELKPMKGLGYKQMVQFLLKELTWEEAVDQMKRETRHYARRQWTWFGHDPEMVWRDASAEGKRIFEEVKAFLREGERP